jgi:GNAT superfamily N-acetyltransferase
MRAQEFIPERVNAEVIEPGYSVRRQLPNGLIIQADAMTPFLDDPDPYLRDLRGVTIRVFDPNSDSWIHDKFGIAEVRFLARQDKKTGEWNLRPSGVQVNPKYQRQGIASAMYNFARMLGNDVIPGVAQTAQGEAFWKKGAAGQGRDLELTDVPEPEKPAEPQDKDAPQSKETFSDKWRRLLFPKRSMA